MTTTRAGPAVGDAAFSLSVSTSISAAAAAGGSPGLVLPRPPSDSEKVSILRVPGVLGIQDRLSRHPHAVREHRESNWLYLCTRGRPFTGEIFRVTSWSTLFEPLTR